MSVETGDMISRVYGSFRGVDFRGDEVNLARSPDALNVWRDYKKTQGVETRPATEIFAEFSEKIFGIYVYGDALIVHSGTKLWRLENGQKTLLYEGVQESRSAGFVFKSTFYFKDGKHYLQYNGESMTDVEGYVPTTCIGKSPNGTATTHEDVNMLQV